MDHATVAEIAELPKPTINKLYHHWKTEISPTVNNEHRGECTNVPMTCRKCKIDEIFKSAATIDNVIKGYTKNEIKKIT